MSLPVSLPVFTRVTCLLHLVPAEPRPASTYLCRSLPAFTRLYVPLPGFNCVYLHSRSSSARTVASVCIVLQPCCVVLTATYTCPKAEGRTRTGQTLSGNSKRLYALQTKLDLTVAEIAVPSTSNCILTSFATRACDSTMRTG